MSAGKRPLLPSNAAMDHTSLGVSTPVLQDHGEQIDSAGAAPLNVLAKYAWLAIYLVGTLGEMVGNKRVQIAAPEFPMALVQLLVISGLVLYPLIIAAALVSGRVRWSQCLVTWWKPAVVGLCFVLHDTLLKIGGRGALPGIIILVLTKLVVPCSMAMSMPACTLRYSYGKVHWGGLVMLLVGVILTLNGQMSAAFHSAHGAAMVFQAVLVALSIVPLAAAFVFLELCLKGEDRDVFTVAFWMWVCVFMMPMTEALVPLGTLLTGARSSKMWLNISHGIQCYVAGVQPDGTGSNCAEARNFWWATLLFTLAANLAMPMGTRHGSATLLWFVRALAVPLGGMLFACPTFMGSHATPTSPSGWAGLACVAFGVLLFNSRQPAKRS